jgi:hypothetical protein
MTNQSRDLRLRLHLVILQKLDKRKESAGD